MHMYSHMQTNRHSPTYKQRQTRKDAQNPSQGRRPRGDWGDGPPQNFRWGTAHALVPPPIFWEVVLSDVRESMNRVKNGGFLVRKWSYTTFNIVNIRKMWEKKGKIRRTNRWLKKRSSEIFTLKMDIFPEIGPRKNFLVPPKFGARSPPMTVGDVKNVDCR